ncbi:hypothetical protein COU60_02425 [Candidatus Pacearchaeota archaeon CG10_big_fil_rev_8_21_14_0_10_34_76]|nr:MAG: hypothetical protein COU60_02425 [Candidatus Pacearchaeota archaeon CG10_big_fil_rev_8_21_14_0_10_34_76]
MKVLDVIILVVLLGLLGAALYLFYINLPGESIQFIVKNEQNNSKIIVGNENVSSSRSKQFYSNMRFPDREITYLVEDECNLDKQRQVLRAFDIIDEMTTLDFRQVLNNPQIIVTCSEIAPEPENKGHFIAGEGGPTQIINTSLYSVILEGKISLFRPEKCERPNIALHEILHVLGFDHNNNPKSILYPTLDCSQQIDNYFIDAINILYDSPGLADLKVSEVNAEKAGRYLDFEIKIINQGLNVAKSSSLRVFADGEIVKFEGGKESFDLGEIEIGTTKILTVENARIGRSANEVIFIVDQENNVDELFEDNNEIILDLTGN